MTVPELLELLEGGLRDFRRTYDPGRFRRRSLFQIRRELDRLITLTGGIRQLVEGERDGDGDRRAVEG